MRPTGIELTQLFFLVEDWIEQDPILNQHFSMWPEVAQEARDKGHQVETRWILRGPRNICYITNIGLWVMNPIVNDEDQVSGNWDMLNHAEPQFFDKLRSYLMEFV